MLVNNPNIYQLKKFVPLFLLLTLFGIGVLIATLMSQQTQDNRNKASTPTGGAQIQIPIVSSYPPGQQSAVAVSFNTAGYQIDGVQLVFTLSGQIPPDFSFTKDPSLTNFEVVTATPSANTYQIALVTINPDMPYTTNAAFTTLGTFNFTNPSTGTLNLTFDPTLTKIIAHSTAEDVLLTPTNVGFNFMVGATPSPSSTITPSGSPTSSPTTSPTSTPIPGANIDTITIRAKLKGVNSDVGTIHGVVKIGAMSSGLVIESINANFTHASGGIYEADISPTIVTSGTGYWISVKGEKHLARSLTSLSLTDDSVIDLTNKILEPGDLPSQDGVIDDNDINAVLFIFTKPTQTTADLAKADVNYDGVVNAIDLGLILSTLSVKPDEAPF